MKKALLFGGISIGVLLIAAALGLTLYFTRPLTLYGQTVRANTDSFALTENVKAPLSDVIDTLSQLRFLKKLDLGPYRVEVREEQALLAAFPGVELRYDTYVSLYGLELEPDETVLDLSGLDLTDLAPLRAALPYLKELKEVISTGTVITRAERDELQAAFPDVAFRMVSSVEIYGQTVTDNVLSLDLRDAETDGDLADKLRLLPNLNEVDLRGQDLSAAEKYALVKDFPGIDFRWEVELLGQRFDSYIEDLDLSGNPGATPDLLREAASLFPRLARLDLSDCGASDEEMAALREDLPGVKVVWRIHMGQWSLKTDAVAFSVLIYNYNHVRLRSRDIEVLKYCTDLQALDLGHQAITDISVIGDYLPELRILILVDNQVSDLSPVAKLKHLHYIELFVNSRNLTDLSPLAQCRELVDVNVSYLYYVRDFSPLFDLPLLERLWIEHTGIDREQLSYIRARYPDAAIITEGEGSIDNGWREHERYFAMIGMFHDQNCRVLSESFSKYDR